MTDGAAVAGSILSDPALKTPATVPTLLCRCEDVTLGQVAGQAQPLRHGRLPGKICATAARYLFDWPLAPPRTSLTPVRTATLLRGAERESDA
ncbi:Uncharacterised protein [Serratia rubidaea]|uniref:Uncharacterized protein n=1 Tax=Serratia rubidaea TaxID=61652 RepID=A0A4U9HF80_SERRU|nr:Uncharacterised protein [Serratia rubidaea]